MLVPVDNKAAPFGSGLFLFAHNLSSSIYCCAAKCCKNLSCYVAASAECVAVYRIREIREKWMQNNVISGLLFFVTFAYGGVTVWHLYGQFLM